MLFVLIDIYCLCVILFAGCSNVVSEWFLMSLTIFALSFFLLQQLREV